MNENEYQRWRLTVDYDKLYHPNYFKEEQSKAAAHRRDEPQPIETPVHPTHEKIDPIKTLLCQLMDEDTSDLAAS